MATPQQLLQAQLDSAFNKSGTSPDQLKRILLENKKALYCDADCQEKRKLIELKQNWLSSKNKARILPDQVQRNEKKYFIAAKGQEYYTDNILRPQFEAQINNFISQQLAELEKRKAVNASILTSYSASSMALSRIAQLETSLQRKNTALLRDIDTQRKNTFTSGRRVYYKAHNLESLEFYNYVIRIIYFSVIALYAILSLIFIKNKYRSILFWIYISFAIALPLSFEPDSFGGIIIVFIVILLELGSLPFIGSLPAIYKT